MRKDAIFDGRQHISPGFVILLTLGIWTCVIAPPLGILIIALAFTRLGLFRSRRRRAQEEAHQYAVAQVVEKHRRDRIKALKAMP